MPRIIQYAIVFLFLAGCFLVPDSASASQLTVVYLQSGDVQINNPDISQSFYDNLKGEPRDYFVNSSENFELYINILVPEEANKDGRYSARIFLVNGTKEQQIAELDGGSSNWQEYYDPFVRDYYLKGPELSKQFLAGKYKIEVYSLGHSLTGEAKDNQGEYVLAVGKKESYDIKSVLNFYWQLPLLKLNFFKTSVLQFFLTPLGIAGVGAIGALLIFLAIIYYLVGLIGTIIKHHRAKTLLLTSAGSEMRDDIIKLLQKPAYDVMVAYINTAKKPEIAEDPDHKSRSLRMMEEMGFNIEEIDIEGKKEKELMKLLELKDIIFVAGGNAFYLLKAMRACNFEKVIRKLLKWGKVYIGSSAGSMVAGRTIKTAGWFGDENIVGLKNLRGLNLVPFDIFPHYKPEYAELIKQKIKSARKRRKKLKILTDGQAILVQGREVDLIGEGEAVII